MVFLDSRKSLVAAAAVAVLAASTSTSAAVITSGITPTASGSFGSGWAGGLADTINGTGLSGTAGSEVHAGTGTVGWMVDDGDGPAVDVWIQWDLGQSYSLDSVKVWNLGNAIGGAWGARSVDVFYSNVATPGDPEAAGAANWTQLGSTLEFAAADDPTSGFDLETLAGTSITGDVRYIRFEINSQWGSAVGGSDDGRVGIGEIQFTEVPEPSSLALMAIGGLLIARRRRA